jgi:EAL domain-containing protein (putative c-di-GMP-specific phosphodiesterase class I)
VQSHKLEPGQLALEIPEFLLAGPGDVGPALRMLHGGGLRLAVDDFGSAGAALATLKELPLDLLKVDAAFIEAIGVDGGSDMAAAIVHLGRALGVAVLAQRVEREDQRVLLAGCGCDEYQGPLFSDCLTADAMLALLTARSAQR